MAVLLGAWGICAPGDLCECLDADEDGIIGSADLAILLGNWGPNPGHPADLNGDGIVNAADLAELLGNWSAP